jgi:two-component system chemotaxis response regulator CheY
MYGHDTTCARRIALVVDDSRACRRILRAMLTRLQFDVEEAENGAQALERLRVPGGIAFVVVDWNMPEMDGIALVREVRADPAFAELKILMVSTEIEMERVAQALTVGVDEYLMKPFTWEMVAEKLALLGLSPENP